MDKKDNPVFVAKDVAAALGYKDTDQAVRRHCRKVFTEKSNGKQREFIIPLHPSAKLIYEADMFALIFKSQLQSAVKFQDWVCEEIYISIQENDDLTIVIKALKILKKIITTK